jgi:predicted phosphodiesterase
VLPNENHPVYHEWGSIKPSLFNQNTFFQNFNFENNEDNLGFQFIKQKQENRGNSDEKKGGNSDEKKGGNNNGDIKQSADPKPTKNEKKAKGQEKKIERLKDRQANDEDNKRLIEQRNEFDKDVELNAFDGYGLVGNTDNTELNFNFAVAGDFGCSENTMSTVANMQRHEPEIVLTLGDLSYHSTADCWFNTMSPLKGKLMITLGHHDTEDGRAKMNQYLESFGLEKPYYSYDYNNVHFLIMSAKSVFYKGSDQYNFILKDLEKASKNENIDWIIVSSYGPAYSSPSKHPAFKELREVYHPIFEKYGVDLVLSGHNHNYQRTYPLAYNTADSEEPSVRSTATSHYDGQKGGIVFAIVGTGGVNLYSFNGLAPFVDTQFADKFGFLNIDISNGNPDTKLTGTFYDNKDSQILDQFIIEKNLSENTN